jgi:hypothetical protein
MNRTRTNFESLSALISKDPGGDPLASIPSIKSALVKGQISLLEYRILTGKVWVACSTSMAYESLVKIYDSLEEFAYDWAELTHVEVSD